MAILRWCDGCGRETIHTFKDWSRSSPEAAALLTAYTCDTCGKAVVLTIEFNSERR